MLSNNKYLTTLFYPLLPTIIKNENEDIVHLRGEYLIHWRFMVVTPI